VNIDKQNETYLSINEACRYLGKSRLTITKYTNAGKIKRYEQLGRYYYKQSELDKLLVMKPVSGRQEPEA
jgi:excisionase family DNA binding protein